MRIQSETEIGKRNVFQERRELWRRASSILSLALVAVMFAPTLARAADWADCFSMLTPLFNPQPPQPNGRVFATITNQTAQNWRNGWPWKGDNNGDPVFYADGQDKTPLTLTSQWWKTAGSYSYLAPTYAGTLYLMSNKTTPPFSPPPRPSLTLKINIYGAVEIDLPQVMPIIGQGTCNNGLVTMADPANPSSQWTLSFNTTCAGGSAICSSDPVTQTPPPPSAMMR